MKLSLFPVLFAWSFATANAATFTVTNTNDSGAGSLRQAVIDARLSGVANTINFAVSGTIVLTSGQIRIASPLSIVGPGANSLTIDGNANDRIFTIIESTAPGCPALSGPNDFPVSISGLTLRNASRNVADTSGGAIFSGKSLTLDSVIIRDSAAKNGGGVAFAVQYPGQSLTIANSQFINNVARPTVPGNTDGDQGGALWATDNCNGARIPATMTIDGSVFSGNQVKPPGDADGQGGAIALNFSGPVVIQDTRIVDNHADSTPLSADYGYNSGGIGGYAKSLTIRRSEIAQNSADYVGGIGAFNRDAKLQGAGSAMQLTIVDSTVSGNVVHQSVGAILVSGNVAATVANSTVAANVADWLNHDQNRPRLSGIGLFTDATEPPSQSNATPPTLQLVSSIVAGGQSSSPDIGAVQVPVPFSVTASNSLAQFKDPSVVLAGSGNRVGVDPLLGPLGFNGGPTRTQALLPGSPAIDAGSNPLASTTDQRGPGFARVSGPAPDMGAYEVRAVTAGTSVAVEYYHAAFGHYFVTAIADEISKLDAGVFTGWARTTQSFKVYAAAASGLAPVCRFFTTAFPPTSSHFYAPRGLGCEGTLTNKDWQYEGDVFFTPLPDANGACPTGASPIFRLYNNGQGGAPNHRFTTSPTIRSQMLASGYIAEGTGIGVGMCSPD